MNNVLNRLYKGLLGLALITWVSTSAVAQQTESPVACSEGSEPLPLTYGDHTTLCTIDPVTDLDRFEICPEPNELLRINLNSLGNFMDPNVVVRDPTAAVIAQESCNDSCALSMDIEIVEDGCHTIFVSDLNTISAGDYSLQVERIFPFAESGVVVDYDLTITDAVEPATDVDHYRFLATAESQLRINIHSPGNFMDPTIEIRRPDGQVVINGVADGATCNDNCAFALDFTPQQSGEYSMIIFDRLGISAGGYSFSIWCLYGDCDQDGDVIPPGDTISYVSETANEIESSVDGDFYRFNASLNTELRLNIHSPNNFMDPTVEIRDPDGDLLIDGVSDNATCNDGCAFSIDLSPLKSGIHSLAIYDRNAVSTGFYDIGLWCLFGPCDSDADGVLDGTPRISYETPVVLAYGIPVDELIDTAVDSDRYIFGGTAGDLIILNVASPGNFMDPTIEIRDPSGQLIVNGVVDGATCNDNCSFNIKLNLNMSGDYSLLIYDRNTISTGTYQIGLQCLIGVCSDALALCGDNCIEVPNGPLIPDAGGNSQLDSDNDGQGNACDGDLDQSGLVNFLDIAEWVPLFLTTEADGDFNGDGFVNFLDLALITNQFLLPPGPACASPSGSP